MTDWWWSWLLTIVGVTGFFLAGKKIWWSWYVNIACQGLWLYYGWHTDQWGFVIASCIYFVVFSRNAYNWTREHRYAVRWAEESDWCNGLPPNVNLRCQFRQSRHSPHYVEISRRA